MNNDIQQHLEENPLKDVPAAKEMFEAPQSDSKDSVDQKAATVSHPEHSTGLSGLKEAPVVWFTNYQNQGFEESITLRGFDIKEVYSRRAIILELLKKNNCTPVVRGKKSYPPKPEPKEVGECPTCREGKLLEKLKDGKAYRVCSTSKYDYQTKTSTGCKHFEWVN